MNLATLSYVDITGFKTMVSVYISMIKKKLLPQEISQNAMWHIEKTYKYVCMKVIKSNNNFHSKLTQIFCTVLSQ